MRKGFYLMVSIQVGTGKGLLPRVNTVSKVYVLRPLPMSMLAERPKELENNAALLPYPKPTQVRR